MYTCTRASQVTASIKVSVSLDDAEKMWDLDMWPVGVCVKRWVKFEH